MLFILAILPVIILLCVIYFFDKFEKEPWWLLALAFALGALIPIPILYLSENIQNIPIPNFYLQKFYHAFIEVALREEGFKFLILFLLIWWSKYFNEYFDGIVYAVFISLGFACVENIMYIVDSYSGVRIALGRAIFSVPGHAIDAIIMGYYFSLAKFIPKRKVIYLAASLSFAVLVHGLYDLFLFWCHAQNNWFPYVSITFFYILVIFMYLLGIWKIKVLKDQQLPNNEANEKIENESFILFIRGILKNMKSICLLIFNKMKTNKKTVFSVIIITVLVSIVGIFGLKLEKVYSFINKPNAEKVEPKRNIFSYVILFSHDDSLENVPVFYHNIEDSVINYKNISYLFYEKGDIVDSVCISFNKVEKAENSEIYFYTDSNTLFQYQLVIENNDPKELICLANNTQKRYSAMSLFILKMSPLNVPEHDDLLYYYETNQYYKIKSDPLECDFSTVIYDLPNEIASYIDEDDYVHCIIKGDLNKDAVEDYVIAISDSVENQKIVVLLGNKNRTYEKCIFDSVYFYTDIADDFSIILEENILMIVTSQMAPYQNTIKRHSFRFDATDNQFYAIEGRIDRVGDPVKYMFQYGIIFDENIKFLSKVTMKKFFAE